MRVHRAFLSDPAAFDLGSLQRSEWKPGVWMVSAKRKGRTSNNPSAWEGFAYDFDPEQFAATQAESFLADLGIHPKRIEAEMHLAVVDAPAFDPQVEMDPGTGTYSLTMEILSTGTFQGVKGPKRTYTEEDLFKMAADTTECLDYLQPPLKLGHGEQLSLAFPGGGEPAMGWVRKVWAAGPKLLARVSHVPRALYEAMTQGRWRRQSSEILLDWTSPDGKQYPAVLKAVALLGAELPAVKGLAGVLALEDGEGHVVAVEYTSEPGGDADRIGDEPKTRDEALRLLDKLGILQAVEDALARTKQKQSADDDQDEDKDEDKEKDMADETKDKAALEAAEKGKADAEAKLSSLEAERQELAQKLQASTLDRLQVEQKITPAERKAAEQFLADCSTKQAEAYLSTFDAREPAKQEPVGKGADVDETKDPLAGLKGGAKLVALADRIVETDKVDYAEALVMAAKRDPQAAKEYDDEQEMLPRK